MSLTGSNLVVEGLILEGELPKQHAPGVVAFEERIGLDMPVGAGQTLRNVGCLKIMFFTKNLNN